MSKKAFPAHGNLQLSVEGPLLIIKGYGPANLEMVQEYQRQVIGFREQIMHAPWASLVLLSGTPLMSPEAKSVLMQTIKQAKVMHLRATAIVLVDVEFAEIVEHFWQDIYQDLGVNYGFFATDAEARLWLQNLLSNETSSRPVREHD